MNQQIIMHKRPPEICEVEATIAIIASKWKPMILFNLWLGALRFSDIKIDCPKHRTAYYFLSNDRYINEHPTAVNLRI